VVVWVVAVFLNLGMKEAKEVEELRRFSLMMGR
jgi:hypothetical protein